MESARDLVAFVRQIVVFLLGVAAIIDALVKGGDNTAQVVIGLVLIGIVPIDVFLTRNGKKATG